MEKKVLVYQAYGSHEICQQTRFSILSLLKQIDSSQKLEVWIYTDQRKFFEDFFGTSGPVKCMDLTAERIAQWKGKISFVHRLKIEMLKDAGARFKGSLFYSDGDTYFLSSPLPLFNKVNDRTSLMHVKEGALDQNTDPLSKKILRFVKKHHFQIQNELVGIGPATEMWNAGVIGVSEKNKSLFSLILELTDQMYALYQKHVMEQLAVSFYLQTQSIILPADGVVMHYWNQKKEYQSEIDNFFAHYPDLESALENWRAFQPPALEQKPEKRPLFRKLLGRK
jgi:hypothetical protein